MRKKKFIFNIILTWSYIVFHSYKILLLNQLSNISVQYLTVSWAIFKFRMHSLFSLKSSNSFTGFTLKALSREKGQQYTSTFFDKIIHLASLQCSTHCNRVVIKASETALLENHQWLWITQSSEVPSLDTFWHFAPLAHSRYWQLLFLRNQSLLDFFLPPGTLHLHLLCWALFASPLCGSITQGPASWHSWTSCSRLKASTFKSRASAYSFLLRWDLYMYLLLGYLSLHVGRRDYLTCFIHPCLSNLYFLLGTLFKLQAQLSG